MNDEDLRRAMIETRLRAHWGDRYESELLMSTAMFGDNTIETDENDRPSVASLLDSVDPDVAAIVNAVDETIAFGRRYAADQLEQLVKRYDTRAGQVMTGTRVRNELRMRITTLRGTPAAPVNSSPRQEFPRATV